MKKYYTPSVEEFHVGFEFEGHHEGEIAEWIKRKFEDGESAKYYDEYRVKHLDHEDIESLGFKHIQIEWDKVSEERRYSKDNYSLLFYSYSISEQNKHLRGSVTIYYRTGDFDGEVIFDGIIKNKSELKKLLKQLGV